MAGLIGRLVQDRSNLAMQEENLVKLERVCRSFVDRAHRKSSGIVDPLVDHSTTEEKPGWLRAIITINRRPNVTKLSRLDTKPVSTMINLH